MLKRMLRPLLHERRSRQRLIEAGDVRFAEELKRHLDRLHDDLAQRVADANRELEQAMEDQVNQVSHAMMVAVERAQVAKNSADQDGREAHGRTARLRDAARMARMSVTPA